MCDICVYGIGQKFQPIVQNSSQKDPDLIQILHVCWSQGEEYIKLKIFDYKNFEREKYFFNEQIAKSIITHLTFCGLQTTY